MYFALFGPKTQAKLLPLKSQIGMIGIKAAMQTDLALWTMCGYLCGASRLNGLGGSRAYRRLRAPEAPLSAT